MGVAQPGVARLGGGEAGAVQKAELGPNPQTSELGPPTVPPSPGSEEGTSQRGQCWPEAKPTWFPDSDGGGQGPQT